MVIDERPIGVFDSGIGGLTVVREIIRQLPGESVLFFGDTARLPYGPKSKETVMLFARQNAHFLMNRGVRSIVIACNTASAVALPALKQEYSVPVLGVIEPGARGAAAATKSGRIGVIGTRGTIASGAYEKALLAINPDFEVHSAPCPLLVPLAEEGWVDHEITRSVIAEYVEPLLEQAIDTLILGCTHFPVLKNAIRQVTGGEIKLIDNAIETARSLAASIGPNPDPGRESSHNFVVSDVPHRFREEAELFLGRPIGRVERIFPEHLEEIYGEQ